MALPHEVGNVMEDKHNWPKIDPRKGNNFHERKSGLL